MNDIYCADCRAYHYETNPCRYHKTWNKDKNCKHFVPFPKETFKTCDNCGDEYCYQVTSEKEPCPDWKGKRVFKSVVSYETYRDTVKEVVNQRDAALAADREAVGAIIDGLNKTIDKSTKEIERQNKEITVLTGMGIRLENERDEARRNNLACEHDFEEMKKRCDEARRELAELQGHIYAGSLKHIIDWGNVQLIDQDDLNKLEAERDLLKRKIEKALKWAKSQTTEREIERFGDNPWLAGAQNAYEIIVKEIEGTK